MKRVPAVGLAVGGLLAVSALVGAYYFTQRAASPPPLPPPPKFPRQLGTAGPLTLWWDMLPPQVDRLAMPTGGESNIRPSDYAGPDSCKQCHPRNYDSWSSHPHRWMNALASEATVKGDFSGKAVLSYRGGQATFFRDGERYLMHLERGGTQRTYQVTQTIGSRYYQYYVGKQIEGPEPRDHYFYTKDHVLQLGYWLVKQEWVPIVHVGTEKPDAERPDPFAPPENNSRHYAEYAVGCNHCHTTFPEGDKFVRSSQFVGAHSPVSLHWSVGSYLQEAHPEMYRSTAEAVERGGGPRDLPEGWEASQYAVTLGVSCEACHLGGKEHVASGGKVPPKFFPESPYLKVVSKDAQLDFGRSHDNVNWACGRCHTGNRPQFAAGMSTWNSVEYSDAMRGSCYSELRCIDCHNPHRPIGQKWSPSAEQDDAVCLKCHEPLRPAEQRVKHTHHPMGSEGARCLNCHMPRVNEGLEDVVRTHMIYSPTRADMIEANHPNACNLCHTDKPIDWTLRSLKQWYGKTYDETKLIANYPQRDIPAALAWLKSSNPAVRLVAVEALTRGKDGKALPQILDALDDPYLVNRQFAAKGLEEMLNLRLSEFGYRFYMMSEERRKPLAELRARFVRPTEGKSE